VLAISLELVVYFTYILLEVKWPDSKQRVNVPHLCNHISSCVCKFTLKTHRVRFVNLVLIRFFTVNLLAVL